MAVIFNDIMAAAQALTGHTAHRGSGVHSHAGINIIKHTAVQQVNLAAVGFFIRGAYDGERALYIVFFHRIDHRGAGAHAGCGNQVMAAGMVQAVGQAIVFGEHSNMRALAVFIGGHKSGIHPGGVQRNFIAFAL